MAGASAQRRMELNRSRVDAVVVAIGHGLNEWGGQLLSVAATRAPDSPYEPYPLGEGLPRQGGVLVYFDGKKVWSRRAVEKEPKVPRAAKISRTRGLVVIVGWGFPARFVEFGTARTRAQPFFAPTVDEFMPRIAEIAGPVVRADLKP